MNIAVPIGLFVLIIIVWLISFGLSKFIKAPVYIISLGIISVLVLGVLIFIGIMA